MKEGGVGLSIFGSDDPEFHPHLQHLPSLLQLAGLVSSVPHRRGLREIQDRSHKMAVGIIPFFFFLTPRTPDEATLGAHPPHPLHQATDSAVRVTIGKWLRGDRGLMGPAVQRPQPRPSAFSAFRGRHSHLSGLGKCTFPGSPTGGNGRGPENLHFNKLPSP